MMMRDFWSYKKSIPKEKQGNDFITGAAPPRPKCGTSKRPTFDVIFLLDMG